MEIEFDSKKDRANVAKHGISLAAAELMFLGPVPEFVDDRAEYGEERIVAQGFIAGRLFVCVYTWRRDVRRVISLRKATRREANAFGKRFPPKGP
jgi:uncharacterized protein